MILRPTLLWKLKSFCYRDFSHVYISSPLVLVWFLNVTMTLLLIFFVCLSSCIKLIAQWRHTGQGGGVRTQRGRLHYGSPNNMHALRLLRAFVSNPSILARKGGIVSHFCGNCYCWMSTDGFYKKQNEHITACWPSRNNCRKLGLFIYKMFVDMSL